MTGEPTHVPCCTAHGVPMTCERYRRTHFVEVRPCCAIDATDGRADQPASTTDIHTDKENQQ